MQQEIIQDDGVDWFETTVVPPVVTGIRRRAREAEHEGIESVMCHVQRYVRGSTLQGSFSNRLLSLENPMLHVERRVQVACNGGDTCVCPLVFSGEGYMSNFSYMIDGRSPLQLDHLIRAMERYNQYREHRPLGEAEKETILNRLKKEGSEMQVCNTLCDEVPKREERDVNQPQVLTLVTPDLEIKILGGEGQSAPVVRNSDHYQTWEIQYPVEEASLYEVFRRFVRFITPARHKLRRLFPRSPSLHLAYGTDTCLHGVGCECSIMMAGRPHTPLEDLLVTLDQKSLIRNVISALYAVASWKGLVSIIPFLELESLFLSYLRRQPDDARILLSLSLKFTTRERVSVISVIDPTLFYATYERKYAEVNLHYLLDALSHSYLGFVFYLSSALRVHVKKRIDNDFLSSSMFPRAIYHVDEGWRRLIEANQVKKLVVSVCDYTPTVKRGGLVLFYGTSLQCEVKSRRCYRTPEQYRWGEGFGFVAPVGKQSLWEGTGVIVYDIGGVWQW